MACLGEWHNLMEGSMMATGKEILDAAAKNAAYIVKLEVEVERLRVELTGAVSANTLWAQMHKGLLAENERLKNRIAELEAELPIKVQGFRKGV